MCRPQYLCDSKVIGDDASLVLSVVNFRKTGLPPTLRQAQTVRVDNRNQLVYSTTAFRPWRSFEGPGTEVVVPTCKATMTKSFRTELPEACVRTMSMWSTALAGGFAVTSAAGCACCNEQVFDSRQCSLCQCSWHPACCQEVLLAACSADSEHTSKPPGDLPARFRSAGMLCNLCAHFYN